MVPRPEWYRGHSQDGLTEKNDSEPWQHTPRAPSAPTPPVAPPLRELRARDHSFDTEMEADRQSLCKVPRGLVVGGVNEEFVCGICDGLLREPRHAGSCSEHLFCRVCYEAALSTNACCPTCKQPVDVSEPLKGFGPFEAMVSSTVVRCPNSTAEGGAPGRNICNERATSREARYDSGSSAPIPSSVHAPGVDEEAGDGRSIAGAGGAGGSEMSSSPFDGVHVGAPSNSLESCPSPLA